MDKAPSWTEKQLQWETDFSQHEVARFGKEKNNKFTFSMCINTKLNILRYHYQCRPIVVVGRDEKECYSAMPVDLTSKDLKRIQENKGENEQKHQSSGPKYFLEPITRDSI
jgi:hypothetical protein